ncbi:MAG: endoglucanase, partial [Chloroflexi bacterium]
MQNATLNNVAWQSAQNNAQPTFYLDSVELVAGAAPSPTPITGLTLNVNATAPGYAISDDIYGMNFADENLAADLALPVRRMGGNATTRYNWQNDTANHAMDWYFENIPESNANPAALPNGSMSDKFVDQDRRTNTKTILTMPLIGWTPKARAYACGFSVAKYGAQQSVDPWRPDCGNGILPNGNPMTNNDPHDTSVAITPQFVQDWIAHLKTNYGDAAYGGVKFYNLDNEPMLWDDTHRDVHPTPTSYDELRDRTYQYAAAIKQADPTAKTLGPALWGWTAYFWSAQDWAAGGNWWNNPPDRNAHGGQPFIEWYLDQMHAYEQQNGVRILDYMDLHYYPQANGVSLSGAGNAATQALRLRSTRSLWDPTYTDESWINEPVNLIPRMRAWRDAHYPGTKLAMTEYNWGAL